MPSEVQERPQARRVRNTYPDGRSLAGLLGVGRRRPGLLGAGGLSVDSDCLRPIKTSAHAPKAAFPGSSG
jgi:hypothetical protein